MNEAKLASLMKKMPDDIVNEFNAATAGGSIAALSDPGPGNGSGGRKNGRDRRPGVGILVGLATVAVFFVAGIIISVKVRSDRQRASEPDMTSVLTNNTPDVAASPVPSETDAGPTAVPALTDIPDLTDAPTATISPVTTDVSTATDEPTISAEPTLSADPTDTAGQTANTESSSTPAPTATQVPTATKAPTATAVPTATAAPTATPEPVPTPYQNNNPDGLAVVPKFGKLMTADFGGKDIDIPYFYINDAQYKPELGGMMYADAAPLDYRALSREVPLLYNNGSSMNITMKMPCIWERLDYIDLDGNLLMSFPERISSMPNSVLDTGFPKEMGTPADALVRVRIILQGDYIDSLGINEYTTYYCIFRVKRGESAQDSSQTRISNITPFKLNNTLLPGETVWLHYTALPYNYNYGTVKWRIIEGAENAMIDPVSGELKALKDGTVRVAAYVEEYEAEITPVDIVIKSKEVISEPEHERPLDDRYKPDAVEPGGKWTEEILKSRANFLVYNARTPDELPVYTYRNQDYKVSPYETDFTFYVQLTDYARSYRGDAKLSVKDVKVCFYDDSGSLIGYSYTNRDGIAMFTIKMQSDMRFRLGVESNVYTSEFGINTTEILNRPFFPGGGIKYPGANSSSGNASLFALNVVDRSLYTHYRAEIVDAVTGENITAGTLIIYGSGKELERFDIGTLGSTIWQYPEFFSGATRTVLEYTDGDQRYVAECTFTQSGNSLIFRADIAGRKLSADYLPPVVVKGMKIRLGRFEQDGELGRSEPLEWLIVKTEGNKALVVSKDVIYGLPFSNGKTASATTNWADSNVRAWLSGLFIENAFNSEELSVIQNSSGNGLSADDKIFLLSVSEAELLSPEQLKANATPFSALCGLNLNSNQKTASWWLRNIAGISSSAYVWSEGKEIVRDGIAQSDNMGIRPAMWIELTPTVLATLRNAD